MKRSILLLLAVCAGYAYGQGRAPQAPVVSCGKVVLAEDVESRNCVGLVVSQSVVHIVPRVSGEILEVGFHDGAAVRKGQMLYRLDPIRYQAAVKKAEAKIAECKAGLEYAENNFERGQTLFQKQAASKDTIESRKSALDVLNANLHAAEAELITAKDDLKNTTIIAPIDGVVGVTNFTVGNYLTPSSGTLVTIIQQQPIRVRFSISTGDFLSMYGSLANMQKSAAVRVKLSDGSMYPDLGTVQFINNEANSRTDAIQIFAEFKNESGKLLAGSTVSVNLSRKIGRKVPAVAPSAVVHDAKGSFVYLVGADHKVKKQYVIPGNSSGELQYIENGLKEGDLVVTGGTHKLFDGMPIEIAPEK